MVNITRFRPQGIRHFYILTQLNRAGLLDMPGVGVEYPDASHAKVVDKYGHYSVLECSGPDEIYEIECS